MPDLDDDLRKPLTPLRRLRFFCEWFFVATWTRGLRLLPRRAALAWGTFLGFFAYLALGSERRVAMANLDIIFGNRRSIWHKREMALATFQRMAEVIMGLLWAPRLTRQAARHLIDIDEATGLLKTLEKQGRGAVVVTPHYGDWELGCMALGHAGVPMLMVAEPLANARLDRLLQACRSSSGNRFIPPKFAVLKLFRALRQGGRIALMCDVNGRRGRGGVWNTFFGLAVFNGVGMAELALRTDSAIVFVIVEPLTNGRHRIVPTVIEPQPTGDHADDVRRLSQHVTDLAEHQIRRKPEPWLWTHKRWKRRPTSERGSYPRYSGYKRVE